MRTKYDTSLSKRLIESFRIPRVIQENLRLTSFLIPLINSRKPDVLIFFSNVRNKQKSSSSSYIRLKHVTYCGAVVYKSWMEGCSLQALEFELKQ